MIKYSYDFKVVAVFFVINKLKGLLVNQFPQRGSMYEKET